MSFNSELTVALDTAIKAGKKHLEFQHKCLSIEIKQDRSPVTEVDKLCENFIRERLLSAFPNDGFLGEESGNHKGTSNRCWIVDPLDGTRPFIRGIPTHSVLISLEENHEPVVGVIHLPAMNITCWGAKNSGAFLNGEKISVSETDSLNNAIGSALGFLEKADQLEGERLFRFMKSWNYNYGFMDAYTYVAIASGKLDLCVNLLDKAWDCTAAACIIKEAGGEFSDISGIRSTHHGNIVLSNGILHEQIISALNS